LHVIPLSPESNIALPRELPLFSTSDFSELITSYTEPGHTYYTDQLSILESSRINISSLPLQRSPSLTLDSTDVHYRMACGSNYKHFLLYINLMYLQYNRVAILERIYSCWAARHAQQYNINKPDENHIKELNLYAKLYNLYQSLLQNASITHILCIVDPDTHTFYVIYTDSNDRPPEHVRIVDGFKQNGISDTPLTHFIKDDKYTKSRLDYDIRRMIQYTNYLNRKITRGESFITYTDRELDVSIAPAPAPGPSFVSGRGGHGGGSFVSGRGGHGGGGSFVSGRGGHGGGGSFGGGYNAAFFGGGGGYNAAFFGGDGAPPLPPSPPPALYAPAPGTYFGGGTHFGAADFRSAPPGPYVPAPTYFAGASAGDAPPPTHYFAGASAGGAAGGRGGHGSAHAPAPHAQHTYAYALPSGGYYPAGSAPAYYPGGPPHGHPPHHSRNRSFKKRAPRYRKTRKN
jgi:hypothetical protein